MRVCLFQIHLWTVFIIIYLFCTWSYLEIRWEIPLLSHDREIHIFMMFFSLEIQPYQKHTYICPVVSIALIHYRWQIIKETITSLILWQTVNENCIFYYEQSQWLIQSNSLLLNMFLSLFLILSLLALVSLVRLSPWFCAFWISNLFPRSNFNFLSAVR